MQEFIRSTIATALVFATVLIFGFFALTIATPEVAHAESIWDTTQMCSGPDCSLCNLVQLGNRVIVWLVGFLFVMFGVIAVIAGFNLVTSAGNPAGRSAAQSKLTNAVIGIVIVFSAWLAVDTLMKALLPDGNTEIGPWNRIECGTIGQQLPAGMRQSFDGDYVAPEIGQQ